MTTGGGVTRSPVRYMGRSLFRLALLVGCLVLGTHTSPHALSATLSAASSVAGERCLEPIRERFEQDVGWMLELH